MKTLTAAKVSELVPSTMVRVSKHDFYHQQVVDIEGRPLPEGLLKKLIPGDVTGRKFTFQLKKHGLKKEWVFDEVSYKTSKANYCKAKELQRYALISEAFTQASTLKEPHIEHALQSLLPLFKGVSVKKTLIAFRNIVQNVANAKSHEHPVSHA